MLKLLEKLGYESLYLLEVTGRMGIFLFSCLGRVLAPPYKLNPIIRQIHFIGSRSVFVILFTGTFTGMVLALQGYYTLRKFGSEGLLGSAVALSLLRELGPVLTALMVIGRAGSAITAEVGIMRNSEQIDALECMAIDPYKYLIAPKFVAGLIAMPLLTFIFDVVGIFGGWAVGVGLLDINQGTFFQSMYKAVAWQDINMGIIKALIFGLLMIWICSVKGYFLHLDRSGGFGAEGVSRTTTSAVVLSSVSILVWDYLISAIML
ncbi:ABC transporter permease [Geothermobacter hydrogeniphilus]|uniref:ABC transporter permease n=1 Tax=Geothermobacter hydrogeniphilus TaxID=1969733 RepID=A0A2K2HC27_9BACT|nr:MlaE family lipid ABC transporter permease subunit [Geothermobacter hydrogeniphilus]PNU20793.1 ABC transporter permease [Geothermobacter hydrogeniphilus]